MPTRDESLSVIRARIEQLLDDVELNDEGFPAFMSWAKTFALVGGRIIQHGRHGPDGQPAITANWTELDTLVPLLLFGCIEYLYRRHRDPEWGKYPSIQQNDGQYAN